MPLRYLFGPVTPEFADQNLRRQRAAGNCLAFDAQGATDLAITFEDSWEAVCARLPRDWRPDCVVLNLPYNTIPACLWNAPVPRVALAWDYNLLWHAYRHRLPQCELVLTDTNGVDRLHRAGVAHALPAVLFGCQRNCVERPWPVERRDIDLLFVGNLNSAVQRERTAWVTRLAKFAERWNVVIRTGVFGEPYRQLLARSRIVFNRSIRGECNLRTFEATAAGCLLFQEADNLEVPRYFQDGWECVLYKDDNLEELLAHYLENEPERLALARAGQARAASCTFEALWDETVEQIEREGPSLQDRSSRRILPSAHDELLARSWQALTSKNNTDLSLPDDLLRAAREEPLSASAIHNALGLVSARVRSGPPRTLAEPAAEHFRNALACDPQNALAGLNLAEALALAGHSLPAVEQASRALAVLRRPLAAGPWLEGGHFPLEYDAFRVEWERAAWMHVGRPDEERDAKQRLLRWRLHALLAELTGDLAHHYEAVLLRPDLALTRASLGRALVRGGHPREAGSHLQQAWIEAPFDRGTAKALHDALGLAGDEAGQRTVADRQRLLARAAPQVVPAEPWFAEAPASGPAPATAPAMPREVVRVPIQPGQQPGVALCMMVKNEEENLPICLRSAADLFSEVVVIDTGSTDRTCAIAASFGARVYELPWVNSFAAARNEGLRHVTRPWALWLDADDSLDDDNRRALQALFGRLGDEVDAYAMKVRSRLGPDQGPARLLDQVRLFRNLPLIRWEYRVHEQILPAIQRLGGCVRWADVAIDHGGYRVSATRRRKLERNLRLLRMDHAERPDDSFTLFNLGWTTLDLGQTAEALPLLRRSLQRSAPGASIVRKLYVLLTQAHRQLGQRAEALAVCREGRSRCPDDAELLFEEASLSREAGDLRGAEGCLLELLAQKPGQYFASVDGALRGPRAIHLLALVLREQNRPAEAEGRWRALLAEWPGEGQARLGLAELFLAQARWPELEEALAGVADVAPAEAAMLRARMHLAREELALAKGPLAEAIHRAPRAVGPRVLLTHALLREGRDWPAAEKALRDLLVLDPSNREARHNLKLLLRKQGREFQAVS